MESATPKCTTLIDKCNDRDSFIYEFVCQNSFAFCNMAMTLPNVMTSCINP